MDAIGRKHIKRTIRRQSPERVEPLTGYDREGIGTRVLFQKRRVTTV